MKVALISTLVLFSCVYLVTAAPIFDDDDDSLFDFSFPEASVDCSKLGCPAESKSCSKRTTTSNDKQSITEEIKCFNSDGQVTKDDSQQKANPYPGSIQSGYEFYGSYSGGSQTLHVGDNHNSNTNNDNVETLN